MNYFVGRPHLPIGSGDARAKVIIRCAQSSAAETRQRLVSPTNRSRSSFESCSIGDTVILTAFEFVGDPDWMIYDSPRSRQAFNSEVRISIMSFRTFYGINGITVIS